MSADRPALLPLPQALAVMQAQVRPLAATRVPAREAVGLVLAEDIRTASAVPALARALTDGWAVEGLAVTGAGPYAPVPLMPPPGMIDANELLPSGTDTILPPDAVVMEGPLAEALADAPPGEGVRRAGEDAAAGTQLARTGERVTGRLVCACHTAGITHVAVRAPRIVLLPVLAAQTAHDPLPMLRRVMAASGAMEIPGDTAPRERAALANAIAMAAARADCVFVVGGTGQGRSDQARAALESAGTLAFQGVALRPGSSVGFGHVDGIPVLLLPRRLDAALAAWLALGRPLVAALAGAQDAPAGTRLALARKLVSAVGMTELHFFAAENGMALPLGCESPPLSALLRATHVAFLPPESEGHAAGETIETERLDA